MNLYIMPNSFSCPREKLSVYLLQYQQNEQEQVIQTEQLKTRTQSPLMCFCGERRLGLG